MQIVCCFFRTRPAQTTKTQGDENKWSKSKVLGMGWEESLIDLKRLKRLLLPSWMVQLPKMNYVIIDCRQSQNFVRSVTERSSAPAAK